MVLQGTGFIEEVGPTGSIFYQCISNCIEICPNLPVLESRLIFEEDENEDESWPWAWSSDVDGRAVEPGETVVFFGCTPLGTRESPYSLETHSKMFDGV